MNLTAEQKALHERAIDLCRQHRMLEWQIIEILQKIERMKIYKKLEVTSLFQYALRFLGLSEPTAYMFISVARRSAAIPALQSAVKGQRLTLSKATRIVSAITNENSAELIAFAEKNSIRAIDYEIARRNPRTTPRESAKPISADQIELKFSISKKTLEKLKRAQSILAQKQGQYPDMSHALEALLDEYLKRQDPVEKARRIVKKQTLCKTEKQPVREPVKAQAAKSGVRTPLTAKQRHQVFARDEGRCTYRDQNGKRCENDRWLHIHHIRPVRAGGTNSPDNLATLCSVHHDLVHQLSLPIEGQVTWLKESARRYG